MKKIYVYIIEVFLIVSGIPAAGQDPGADTDSVTVPLKVRAGLEITGPVIFLVDKNILNIEVYSQTDINAKTSVYLGGGYSDYDYSQYNYSYKAKGSFYKAGVDFNLLRPELAEGKYWAGIGIHYGLSRFSSEIPSFRYENYWGTLVSSVPRTRYWGHCLELTGGFRAELLRNVSIGWQVSLRKLILTDAPGDMRPVYYPGIGDGGRSVNFGIGYYISVNIPYRKIKVAKKQETEEEPEEESEEESLIDMNNRSRQGIMR